MSDKTQVLFQCTEQFKAAVNVAANKKGMSLSEFLRTIVGEQIGYDFSKENRVDGRKKYASAEARKENQRKQQRTERANVAKLIQIYKSQEHAEVARILQESLDRKEANKNV